MPTINIEIEEKEWTLLSSSSAQVQCLSQTELLIMESETPPTDKETYTILLPKKMYTYQKSGAENLYGYCELDTAVSITAII